MKRPLLWIALACHLLFASAYLVGTPAHEGPDENDHCYYASYLKHTGTLPVIDMASPVKGGSVAHHPPLYYALLGVVMEVCGSGDYTPCWSNNPDWQGEGPGRNVRWQHGHDEAAPRSPEIIVLWAMRCLSVLFGLGTVLLIHRLGLAVFGEWPRVADLAALLVACTPQWSWVHGCLDNGNLATLLSTSVLLVTVHRMRDRNLGPGAGVVLGGLCGVALATKLTAIYLLPMLACAYGYALLVWRDRRRQVLLGGVVALGCMAAVAGWWFWRNWQLYRDPLAMNAHRATFAASLVPDELRLDYLTGRFLTESFGTSLAGFGWATVRLPVAAEIVALVVIAWAVCGWLRCGGVLARSGGVGLALCCVTVLVVTASLVRYNTVYIQPQGRYLFPAYGPFAILISAGLLVPWRRRRARWPLALCALPPLAATAAFWLVFLPALPTSVTAKSPQYASLIDGLVTAQPADRATIVALSPDIDAATRQTPTFRWRNPAHRDGDRYSIHLVTAAGLPIATYESGLIEIADQEWTMPDAYWQSLATGEWFTWKVRRLPDRAQGEVVRDVPESAPRRLLRVE